MSLRGLTLTALAVTVATIVPVAILLIANTTRLHESTRAVARDSRSDDLADVLQVEIQTWAELRNLYVDSRESRLDAAASASATRARQLLAELDRLSGSEAERGLLREIRGRLKSHLAERRELEADDERSLAEIVRRSRPSFQGLVWSIRSLRSLNEAELEKTLARAARLDGLSDFVAGAVLAVVLTAIVIIIVGLRRWVVAPVRRLVGAIQQLGAGDRQARAPESGLRELAQIGQALNETAAALGRQREEQLAFLAGVAHDLRTPLSAVKCALEVLRRSATRGGQDRSSQTMELLERQVDLLGRMLTDLMDASQIEAGRMELRVQVHDLREGAREVARLYAPTSSKHELVLELPERPLMVRADPLRLQQVVSNLISNAIKYSPDGGPVRLRLRATADEAVLSVADRGTGIAAAELSEIFKPFRRGRATPETVPGAGLGLSIVRRIVAAHGGSVEVHSAPGVGSTFSVRLPRTGPVSGVRPEEQNLTGIAEATS